MPWSVKKMNDKFCVVKEGETSAISGGCHGSKSEAADHMRALYASEAENAVLNLFDEEVEMEELALEDEDFSGDSFEFSDSMTEYAWSGPIVFENVFTGDNRVFKTDSINWQEDTLPWAFRWQKASGQGHAGSVPVGRVDRLERRDDGSIFGFGVVIPELSVEAAEYLKMLKSGVGGGVSVDGDSAQFEIQEEEGGQPKVEFSSMRLRALSAVDIPAFNGARIKLIEAPTEGPATELEADAPEALETEVVIPVAETPEINLREELAKKKAKKKAMGYSGWAIDDSLTAAAIPVLPSTEAFVDPHFDGPTALTVTPDGRVFGHLALFNTCHIGFPGTCVKPPKGSKYQYFHTGQIETAEGDLVDCGKLTFKTGHADMNASPRIAADHYDNTGTVAADVRAGEDKFGIWVVGALRPHLSDEDIRAFRCAPLSGDWRRIAGRLELVGALGVNTPGFPVPRVRAMVASGETETLFTFLEDDDEEFNPTPYEISLRLDKKADFASKVSKSLGEVAPKEITEEVPEAPTKKQIEESVKNYTKNQLFKDLKELRVLLDDPDSGMSAKVKKGLEDLYSLAIKADDTGKRFSYNGLDLDIIENSGLEIEEWEAQLEFSGLDVHEFYNLCHDKDGQFCPGSDGPGRVRDNAVKGKHAGPPGAAHGTGGKSVAEHDADHAAYNASKGRPPRTPSTGNPSTSTAPTSTSTSTGGNPPSGGGGVNLKVYENYITTRKRARGWAIAATVAAAALNSPVAGLLQGLATAGGVAIAGNPAILGLLFVTGVAYAAKNTMAARKHRAEFNRSVQKKLARDSLNERQQRERDRLHVTT